MRMLSLTLMRRNLRIPPWTDTLSSFNPQINSCGLWEPNFARVWFLVPLQDFRCVQSSTAMYTAPHTLTPPPPTTKPRQRQLHAARCPINKSVRRRSLPFVLSAFFPTSTESPFLLQVT